MFDSSSLSVFNSADNSVRSPLQFPSQRSQSSGPELAGPKILVVDDEKLITDTLSEILVGAAFQVVSAYDGWSAIEAARHFCPDYLLSDVLMPRMNGVELAMAIRKMHPSVKIVLFSGQAGISEILLEGQRNGLEFDLIAKPIHPLRLIERLREEE